LSKFTTRRFTHNCSEFEEDLKSLMRTQHSSTI